MSSIRSVIIPVIRQIGLPLRVRPILFITRMITDRIELHTGPITIMNCFCCKPTHTAVACAEVSYSDI